MFKATSASICYLLLLATVSYALYFYTAQPQFFSLSWPKPVSLAHSVGALPVSCAAILILQALFPFTKQTSWKAALYTVAFILVVGPLLSLTCVFGLVGLYVLNRFLPKSQWAWLILMILSGVILLVPIWVYSSEVSLTNSQMLLLLIVKGSLSLRLLSWVVDRRIYERTDFSSLGHFIEFFLCPVFFLLPGEIQTMTYTYFHNQKCELQDFKSCSHAFFLGCWGLGLMILFSIGEQWYWNSGLVWFLSLKGKIPFAFELLVSLFWLIFIYFLQTAGMSLQVACLRYLGYQVKYDMHKPLLSRSPIDYLRRHSSYVRDYVIEVGVRPLTLAFARRGWNLTMAYFLALFVTYSITTLSQLGYRPDYHRSLMTYFPFVGSVMLFVTLAHIDPFTHRKLSDPADDIKPLRQWSGTDFLRWGFTTLLTCLRIYLIGLMLK